MKDTVTLKELFAIVVRRGKLVLTMALVFALLLGGVQTYRQVAASKEEQNSPEKIEERYQDALEQYELDKAELEKQLSNAQRKLESQQEYNENCLLMRLDPYNKYVTLINFAVTDVEEGAFQQVFRAETTPIDYLISKIQSQYLLYWDYIDLEKALKDSPYAGASDKYLREMVTLYKMDGGSLTVKAYGEGESESRQLGEAVFACLRDAQPVISAASYTHTFSVLSQVTKNVVDEDLAATQENNLANLESYETNVEDLTKQLEELKEPEREEGYAVSTMLKSIAKWIVLGIALGAMLGLAWAMVSYLFRGCVETSREMEQGLQLDFLGSAAVQKNLWNRLADRILRERVWKGEEQALAYIRENTNARLGHNDTVALVTTLSESVDSPAVQAVVKAVSGEGRTVRFVGDVGHNAEAVGIIRSCDGMILAERAGVSQWNTVSESVALSKRLETPAVGFVLI